jgi:hypothetical protein
MVYYVVGPDGNRYGPADLPTLNAWIAQGRIAPQSILEDAHTRSRTTAGMVPGLIFAAMPPTAAPAPFPYSPPPAYSPGSMTPFPPYAPSGNSTEVQLAWGLGALGLLTAYLGWFMSPFLALVGWILATKSANRTMPGARAAGYLCLGAILFYVLFRVVYPNIF